MSIDVDRYTAVRNGPIYCSPACGLGCTHADYLRASKAADAACNALGDGWSPEVFDNLGWHWSIHKGCVTVRPSGSRPKDGYSAWIEPGVLIGQSTLQIIANGPTPEDALGNATQDARTVMARLNEALAVLNDLVAL